MGNNLPTSENTEIFTMRISTKLKEKLNQLAKKDKFGGSASAVIRELIESAYKR
jgi:predicted DNA-binding protein